MKKILAGLLLFVLCFYGNNAYSESRRAFKVSINPKIEGGNIYIRENRFNAGDKVVLQVIPDSGRVIVPGSLSYRIGNKYVPIRANSFFMPATDIEIFAAFDYEYSVVFGLDVSKIFLNKNEEFQINPIIRSEKINADEFDIVWQSDNPAVAQVDENGRVIGLKNGNAKIQASNTKYGKTAFCEVKVTDVKYEINAETQTIISFSGEADSEVLQIPAIINGCAIKEIGEGCFSRLGGVSRIVVSDGISLIHDRAFEQSEISAIVFETASQIGLGARCFANCRDLQTVTFKSDKVAFLGRQVFENCEKLNKIEVPSNAISAYSTSVVWQPWRELIRTKDEFRVSVATVENGSLLASCFGAESGKEVFVTVEPNNGYVYEENSLVCKFGGQTMRIDGNSFKMPANDVEISAKFIRNPWPVDFVSESGDGLMHGNPSFEIGGGIVKIIANAHPGWICKSLKLKLGNVVFPYENGKFSFDEKLLSSNVIFAWEKLEYDIEIIDESHPSPLIVQVGFGDKIRTDLIHVFQRLGYHFDGFYLQEKGKGKKYIDKNLNAIAAWDVASGGKIFANWEADSFFLTLATDEETIDRFPVFYANPLPDAKIPNRDNAKFIGYFDGNEPDSLQYYDEHGKSVRNCDIPADFTLYARFLSEEE